MPRYFRFLFASNAVGSFLQWETMVRVGLFSSFNSLHAKVEFQKRWIFLNYLASFRIPASMWQYPEELSVGSFRTCQHSLRRAEFYKCLDFPRSFGFVW